MLTFLDGDFTPQKQVLACLPLRWQDSHRDVTGGRCDLLILDSSLLWQTVSNSADKSTATQIVHSGGSLWLHPIAMFDVNCNRVEVVEFSRLKPCWSVAGRRYLLMVGRISVSRTFATGQRSEIGRYEDHWEVSLPDLGIGMINEDFHIAGI